MLPGALTQKVGPLPAWAWGLIVGAGVLGLAYMRSRNSSAAADQAAADAAGGDGTADPNAAPDAGNLQNVDGTNPLDFAGPTSGASYVGPGVPQSLRIDPAQWARLQKELRDLKRREHRDHQRNPKHKKHRGTPTTPHTTMRQPSRQRPRVSGQTVNSGSGGGG